MAEAAGVLVDLAYEGNGLAKRHIEELFNLNSLKNPKRILFINTMNDAMGDEIIRANTLACLMAHYPDMEVKVASYRPWLYNEKRVTVVELSPGNPENEKKIDVLAAEEWDLVFCLRVNEDKGRERIPVFSKTKNVITLPSLDYRWVIVTNENNSSYLIGNKGHMYNVHLALAKAMGLNVNKRDVSLFVSEDSNGYKEVKHWINTQVESNGRPLITLVPFGSHPKKGFTDMDKVVNLINGLVAKGFAVLIVNNMGSDPNEEQTKMAIELKGQLNSPYAFFLPSSREADKKTWIKHFVQQSKGIISVEGGLGHLGFNLNKDLMILVSEELPTGKDFLNDWIPPYINKDNQKILVFGSHYDNFSDVDVNKVIDGASELFSHSVILKQQQLFQDKTIMILAQALVALKQGKPINELDKESFKVQIDDGIKGVAGIADGDLRVAEITASDGKGWIVLSHASVLHSEIGLKEGDELYGSKEEAKKAIEKYSQQNAQAQAKEPQDSLSSPERVVVIGDLHAQMKKAEEIFIKAGIAKKVKGGLVISDDVRNGRLA
ncbi:MAG TPA: hypothetical protein DEQ77_05950, partial [Candidatus Omnitrophica bacterium]|nr:hypothetical protein [Candidatus Omnitrophota bacterium]